MDSRQPSEARSLYLNGQSIEQKAAILERASQIGPGPEDADWLLALAAEKAAKAIGKAAEDATTAIRTDVGSLNEHVALLQPMSEAVKEMASDLRRLRASVAHGARPGRWAMFGTFAAGLVVALVGAASIEYMGARPHATLWLNFDGLRLIGAWVFSVAAIGAGATWFSTRC